MTGPLDRLSAALADRYTLERELGAGGMATVYLAQDIKHDRQVAIKVLRPELAAVIGAERFLAEIKTTANLQHPHILPLFDSGVAMTVDHDGSSTMHHPSSSFLFYVMPFVDGESLRDTLNRERQLDIAESLAITQQVASALAYAHERGIVHRDIKPENILLSSGQAIVADFGIARAIGAAGGEQLTRTGTAIGTPAYMSPEQSAGISNIDGRSDTYSLASVLYEMLTGEPPYTGATAAAIIAKRLGTTAPSARVLRDTVPTSVDRALQRAMQRAPADRFATTMEFAAALGGGVPELRVSRRLAFATIAVLAIAAAAWFGLRGNAADPTLDADVIAVLPFRVGGDDSSIAYLRESMLDLMQARLSSGTGARTVEPRTLLAAWRRTVGNEKDDLSEDASRALARQLGAGRVLLGSAIVTPTELTLSATLIRVSDGKVLAQEKTAGAADSVAVLVNRLTAALLIRNAGEARERASGLATAPLDALQDYLAGRKAYRRGDYFGAMALYGKALQRDSMFVDAAFAMVATNAWIGNVFESAGWLVVPQVSRLRDRLSPRDLALFLAIPMVGPNYPRPSTDAEIIAQAEHAAELAPDSPEHWLLLGQLFSHYGAAANRTDWALRSADALDRAIGLDSSFALAIGERLFTAMAVRDTSAISRFSKLFEAHVTSGFADDAFLWAAAFSSGDSATAIRWRNHNTGLSHTDVLQKLVKISLHSAAFALPLSAARWAGDSLQRAATTAQDVLAAGLVRLALGFAQGKTELGDVNSGKSTSANWAATLIQQSLIEPGYRAMAASVLAQEAAGKYRLPSTAIRWPPIQDCFGTLYQVVGGDTARAAAAIGRLRAFASTDRPPVGAEEWQHVDHRVCPLLLQVLLEGPRGAHVAWPALDQLDSLMRGGPRSFLGIATFAPVTFANFTVARMREAQGDIPAALAAIRRREVDYFPAYLWSLPAFLRQEGRLAAMAGDTSGALRAYEQYLTLRTDPDPPFRAQRNSVLAERSALRRK